MLKFPAVWAGNVKEETVEFSTNFLKFLKKLPSDIQKKVLAMGPEQFLCRLSGRVLIVEVDDGFSTSRFIVPKLEEARSALRSYLDGFIRSAEIEGEEISDGDLEILYATNFEVPQTTTASKSKRPK